MAPLLQLLTCTVRLSIMLLSSLSGALSSKMTNRLLLRVCRWWTGCKSCMFESAMGSCDVVGIQVGVHVVGGAIVCALVHVTLGDGPSIGTLGSGMVGYHGHGTLSDGMSVAIGFDVPWWRIGRRISWSLLIACVCATEALVEVGTVPPRVVRVSVASSIVCSTGESAGVVQCTGYSGNMLATQYRLVPGI